MLHMTHTGYPAGRTLCGIGISERQHGDIFIHHRYVDENKLTGHRERLDDGTVLKHSLCLACRDSLGLLLPPFGSLSAPPCGSGGEQMRTGMKTLREALESMATRYEQANQYETTHINTVGKRLRELLDLYQPTQSTVPTTTQIYLLRASQRDFFLDGYATDEEGIKRLALKFLAGFHWLNASELRGVVITVNMEAKTVVIDVPDRQQYTFYITALGQA